MTEPNLIIIDSFLPDSQTLFQTLVAEVAWDERMQARKTASFGKAYNYSGMTHEELPMPERLVPIIERLGARIDFHPNNCLLNFYESGEASMGFHIDSLDDLVPGSGVAIVSLGDQRTLTFRSREDKLIEFSYPLLSGSMLYMPPEIQDHWKHGVQKQAGAGGRISLTFRQLA